MKIISNGKQLDISDPLVIGGGSGVGSSMAGKTVSPTSDTTVTAGGGAEIFNDYRERKFNNLGSVTAGNIASGSYSHAEGEITTASGRCSHAEGYRVTASGGYSHTEGGYTTASEGYAHAEGNSAIASDYYTHAEGCHTTASAECAHAEGYYTTANNYASHVCGKRNKNMQSGGLSTNQVGDAFIIGNGASSSSFSNALRLAYEGTLYLTKAYKSTGADYAEYFEWLDGNPQAEDRVGRFVTLEGDKIKLAKEGDYI